MKNHLKPQSDMASTDFDDYDKFEFEEHDDLREFFEDADMYHTNDLI